MVLKWCSPDTERFTVNLYQCYSIMSLEGAFLFSHLSFSQLSRNRHMSSSFCVIVLHKLIFRESKRVQTLYPALWHTYFSVAIHKPIMDFIWIIYRQLYFLPYVCSFRNILYLPIGSFFLFTLTHKFRFIISSGAAYTIRLHQVPHIVWCSQLGTFAACHHPSLFPHFLSPLLSYTML